MDWRAVAASLNGCFAAVTPTTWTHAGRGRSRPYDPALLGHRGAGRILERRRLLGERAIRTPRNESARRPGVPADRLRDRQRNPGDRGQPGPGRAFPADHRRQELAPRGAVALLPLHSRTFRAGIRYCRHRPSRAGSRAGFPMFAGERCRAHTGRPAERRLRLAPDRRVAPRPRGAGRGLLHVRGARELGITYLEELARYLGFRWLFVPYSAERWRAWSTTDAFKCYFRAAGNLTSVPHLQDWPAVFELTEQRLIPADGIFVPGHTGDFLTGGHVPRGFAGRSQVSRRTVLDAIERAHYSLWDWPGDDRRSLREAFDRRIERVAETVADGSAARTPQTHTRPGDWKNDRPSSSATRFASTRASVTSGGCRSMTTTSWTSGRASRLRAGSVARSTSSSNCARIFPSHPLTAIMARPRASRSPRSSEWVSRIAQSACSARCAG